MNSSSRDSLPGDEEPQVQTEFIVRFEVGAQEGQVFIVYPGYSDICIGNIRGEKLMEMLNRTCSAVLTQSTEETSRRAKALLVEMGWERPF